MNKNPISKFYKFWVNETIFFLKIMNKKLISKSSEKTLKGKNGHELTDSENKYK